eukprot:TRINITY_DN24398_c0_g1_i2.p1 TRINITY_DN24398_c0_g1~~TRINITY_DN24398_c0_g1_i2.p1  ORF type:complete len:215 (+),score=56.56 TRINITY_DN24398_c0_g1_i2:171-815(+)
MLRSLVGSEMCIRDRVSTQSTGARGGPMEQQATLPEQQASLPEPPRRYYTQYYAEGTGPAPPAPPTGEYTMFGQKQTVVGEMARLGDDRVMARGITQQRVYQEGSDPKEELRKLNHAVLLNLLEVLEGLSANCGADSEYSLAKLEDLRTVLSNMFQLINQYRPNQGWSELWELASAQEQHQLASIAQLTQAIGTAAELVGQAPAKLGQAQETEP